MVLLQKKAKTEDGISDEVSDTEAAVSISMCLYLSHSCYAYAV